MNGQGVRYPAFLLGRSHAKFRAFDSPHGLFISDRFRPVAGDPMDDMLIDSSGRSWRLHAVAAVGRWGSWGEVLELWWKRRYRVEYEATEAPTLGIEDMRRRLLDAVSAMSASVRKDRQVDKDERRWRLERWRQVQDDIVAANKFDRLTPAMWPWRLSADSWFSAYGRSTRQEFLAVVAPSITMVATVWHFKFGGGPMWAGVISFLFGFLLPGALCAAAMCRRLHDFGVGFALAFFPSGAMLGWVAEEMLRGKLHIGDQPGWPMLAAVMLAVAALGVLPGIPGENQFGPDPNPGPSL